MCATGPCGGGGKRSEDHGYDGLYDRRKGRPSPKRVPLKTVEKVLQLYREKYFDFNVANLLDMAVTCPILAAQVGLGSDNTVEFIVNN